MFKALTLVSLLHLALPAFTSPCAVFDSKFNLYAFGLGGKDWNAGPQDSWASGAYAFNARFLSSDSHSDKYPGKATEVTTSGRP